MCRWIRYAIIVLTYVQITEEFLWKGSDDDWWDGGGFGCRKGCGHGKGKGGKGGGKGMDHHHHTMVIIERKHKSKLKKILFWWWPFGCKHYKPVVVKTCADSWSSGWGGGGHNDHWGGGCDCKGHKGHKSHKSHKGHKGHKGWDDDDDDDDHWYVKKKKKHETHIHHHNHDCGHHWEPPKITHHHVHYGHKKGKKKEKKKKKHKEKKKKGKKKGDHDIIILNDGDHWGGGDHWDSWGDHHVDPWEHVDSWGHGDIGDVWSWVDGHSYGGHGHKKGKKGKDKFDVDAYVKAMKSQMGIHIDRQDGPTIVNGAPMESQTINRLTKIRNSPIHRLPTVKSKLQAHRRPIKRLPASQSLSEPPVQVNNDSDSELQDKEKGRKRKIFGFIPIG